MCYRCFVIRVAIGARRLVSVGVAQCLRTLAPTSRVGLTSSCVSSLGHVRIRGRRAAGCRVRDGPRPDARRSTGGGVGFEGGGKDLPRHRRHPHLAGPISQRIHVHHRTHRRREDR
jgi:hypothetical protein